MSRNVPLHGVVAYPITPFGPDGGVDLPKLRSLVDRLLAGGVHGIAPLGSAGVLPYLSDEEREAVAEAVVSQVAGRVPTLVGVSALTTERTVHHARVADAVSIPIMAYNNPATGGLDMTPEFLARLLEIPNVTMVKESTGDVNRLHRLVQAAGEDVAFFNGSNPLALDAFVAGATGWCTAAANLIPRQTIEVYDAIRRSDLPAALRSFRRQLPLLQFLVRGGLPRTVAAGLEILGFDPGPLRLPLRPVSEAERGELKEILAGLSPAEVS